MSAIFFGELAAALDAYEIEMLAFALMSNHHHAVLRSPPEESYRRLTARRTKCGHYRQYPRGHCNSRVLSQFMRRLHRVVAVKLQLHLGLSGHFWEKRYHSREILGPTDLVTTIAYDHRNPVRAGITLDPTEYPLSTAAAYAGAPEDSRVPLAPESRLPFDLTWGQLQGRVRTYQSTRLLDDVIEALSKRGIDHTHPDYEALLRNALGEAGI